VVSSGLLTVVPSLSSVIVPFEVVAVVLVGVGYVMVRFALVPSR